MTWILTVTDLKQYAYCPRVLYFMRCQPDVRPITAKMAEGILAHEAEEMREQRRQLRTYGFKTGERHFGVSLYSSEIGLTALIDMVILRPDDKPVVVPVDYKMSDLTGPHFKLQLACYGLLLEEEMSLPAQDGFIYMIPERRAERVPLTEASKLRARAMLTEMRQLVDAEAMPAPVRQPGRCVNCEFRRFCNDVL